MSVMENNKKDDEMFTMMAEYMEKGFLENIEDMLNQDPALFAVLPQMISDERSRVRIGAVAIAEDMRGEHMAELREQIPVIAEVLKTDNPTLRGDAVYLLSAIGHTDALAYLEAHMESHPEEHPAVADMVREVIQEIKGG